jgi:hypothetical protein
VACAIEDTRAREEIQCHAITVRSIKFLVPCVELCRKGEFIRAIQLLIILSMQLVLVIIMLLSEQERMKACGGIIIDRLQLVLDI